MVEKLCERMLAGPAGVERPFTAEEMVALARSVGEEFDCSNYQRFKCATYTRNRVHLNEHFELVVICWESGQASSIHDHGRSNCLYRVIAGTMVEEQFELDADGEPQPTVENRYGPGQITIVPGHLIHRINNEGGEQLVTLHIYSPPLDDAVTHFTPVPVYEEE